jgi:hypothetical protein
MAGLGVGVAEPTPWPLGVAWPPLRPKWGLPKPPPRPSFGLEVVSTTPILLFRVAEPPPRAMEVGWPPPDRLWSG